MMNEQVVNRGMEFRCGDKEDSGKCSADEDGMAQTMKTINLQYN